MIRVAVIIAASLALAGCSSFSVGDWMPGMSGGGGGGIPLKLESDPPGADARTSVGPGCRTPCAVAVPASDDLTVTFALAGYETQIVPVGLVRSGGTEPEFFTAPQFNPNPVFAALQPAAPPPAAKKKTRAKPRTTARPAAEQPAAERPAAAPPPSTGTTRSPAPEAPASQRSIPGSAPTTPPASAWPPPR